MDNTTRVCILYARMYDVVCIISILLASNIMHTIHSNNRIRRSSYTSYVKIMVKVVKRQPADHSTRRTVGALSTTDHNSV